MLLDSSGLLFFVVDSLSRHPRQVKCFNAITSTFIYMYMPFPFYSIQYSVHLYLTYNVWQCTVGAEVFSTNSPWSVFICGEMAVICHKISVKCRWNHGETFTAKIYKLGPKCRWNILIVGDNTAAKIKSRRRRIFCPCWHQRSTKHYTTRILLNTGSELGCTGNICVDWLIL